jgi:ribosomal protein S8E
MRQRKEQNNKEKIHRVKKDKKSEYYEDPNFITRATLSEIQKQKAIKVVEDMLAKKKDSNSADVGKKDKPKDLDNLSPVLKKKSSVFNETS